ncbi:MAG TPA: hypothetical protein VF587_03805 [Solirubrobacteraceae bacterium]|jgi:hypothetical protein
MSENKKIRVPHLIIGLATAFASIALALAGAGLLWADGEKDRDGYVLSGSTELRSGSGALVSENIDLDGTDWLFGGDDFGDVRLKVSPEGDAPVFVGIARTDDVRKYLRDVGHTVVDEIDEGVFGDFSTDYREIEGDRRAAPPANADIWAASASGTGEQKLDWHLDEGDWSIVVMNEDGSPGVTADVEAGAKAPFLDELGWTALGGGAIFGGAAAALLIAAFRPPNRPAAPPITAAPITA